MCTGIYETAPVTGSGKGEKGWFKLGQVVVSYDHPVDANLEHAVNLDFVNQEIGPGARIAVELSPESAKALVEAINTALSRGEAELPVPKGAQDLQSLRTDKNMPNDSAVKPASSAKKSSV